jgi:hypothetical protein
VSSRSLTIVLSLTALVLSPSRSHWHCLEDLQYYAKKLVTAPVKLLLPGGRLLFGVRDTAAFGVVTMGPYLKQKGAGRGELREAVALVHRWKFRRFGSSAYALSAVPVLSWLFAFTNSVGAALWAADFERGCFQLVPA